MKFNQPYYLAQVNVATLRTPVHDPTMTDFRVQICRMNALADTDPGFVWRLRSEGTEDATNIHAFNDDRTFITLSVWRSLESLTRYVYQGVHLKIMLDRRRWFELPSRPILALWWIPAGHTPTVDEAKERLEHLRCHGPTSYAFSFSKPFANPNRMELRFPQLQLLQSKLFTRQNHFPKNLSTTNSQPFSVFR